MYSRLVGNRRRHRHSPRVDEHIQRRVPSGDVPLANGTAEAML